METLNVYRSAVPYSPLSIFYYSKYYIYIHKCIYIYILYNDFRMNVSALEKSSVCDVEFNVNCTGICSNFVKCFFVLVSIKKP
jgi:hypothetical protein